MEQRTPTIARLNTLFVLREDGVLLWRNPPKRHQRLLGKPAGRVGKQGYVSVQIDDKKHRRGRIVFAMTHGRWPRIVDHVNGIKDDDRAENLREATHAENARNMRRHYERELPMGVRIVASGRFQARINNDGRLLTIGTFDTVDAANTAYQQKRKELFGEFA